MIFRKLKSGLNSGRRNVIRILRRWRRQPVIAIPVVTISVLLVLTGIIYMLTRNSNAGYLPKPGGAKIVIISHDHVQQVVPSKEQTVGALLDKLHIALHEGDVVEPAAVTPIDQDEFRINIYRALPVEVVDGSKRTFTFSAGTTPRAIAQQTGTRVYAEDDVTADPTKDFLGQDNIGQQVVINRAKPIVLNLYGTTFIVRSHAPNVADLIRQKHIHLAKDDTVTPAQSTPLTPNIHVLIERKGVKIETVTETIAMPIQIINDPNLAYGTNAVRQSGSPGQKVVTYQDMVRNGVVVGRSTIQTVVTQQPVAQIVVIGTSLSGIKGDMALAGISPSDYTYVDYIVSRESGWCPTKAQGQWGGCPPYAGYVPSYGGYGLCQSTPGSKMSTAGADWATNPITQLRWCSGYARGRYGSWHNAYAHWLAYHNW